MTIDTVILDIEGTTTPLTFVHDVLFPFIRKDLNNYLNSYYETYELQNDIKTLYNLYLEDIRDAAGETVIDIPKVLNPEDSSNTKQDVIKSVAANILYQMDRDRKSTALKQFQGHMWKVGYDSTILKGVVYDDVPKSFARWRDANVKMYIYSSGSIAAQKLLFNFSTHGSLIPFLSGHFDTTIGSKLESSSYTSILNAINKSPDSCLFVTDSIFEAKAAYKAGLHVCLSLRPGNNPINDPDFSLFKNVSSFEQLFDKFEFK
ncbi:hypothetical protein CYY_005422 [Polysphondylium violaceum]|uniref:Enolase-phosphatase E1 n=1 Tax=Polysphondylium violaceum TaxID=133409 RepID=A0A8J4UYN7_9MYCE|nr:hypothetical protein CYY_005422 [Polysphondylium violaceum]